MGLDITAYSNLSYVGHHEQASEDECSYDEETWERVHVEAFAYNSFPHALMGVPNVQSKRAGGEPFLSGGCFAVTSATESHSFRAGSYSGYGQWRSDLAALFNPYREQGSPSPERPFYELIWFADNEGTIFTQAATSLLEDFRKHEDAYRHAHVGMKYGDYLVRKYLDWMRACELAAQNGCIDFH